MDFPDTTYRGKIQDFEHGLYRILYGKKASCTINIYDTTTTTTTTTTSTSTTTTAATTITTTTSTTTTITTSTTSSNYNNPVEIKRGPIIIDR